MRDACNVSMVLAGKHKKTKKKVPEKKEIVPAAVSPTDDASEVSEIVTCTAKADAVAENTNIKVDIDNVAAGCNSIPDGHADATNHETPQDTSSDTTDKKKRTLPDAVPPPRAAQAGATAASRKRRRY